MLHGPDIAVTEAVATSKYDGDGGGWTDGHASSSCSNGAKRSDIYTVSRTKDLEMVGATGIEPVTPPV